MQRGTSVKTVQDFHSQFSTQLVGKRKQHLSCTAFSVALLQVAFGYNVTCLVSLSITSSVGISNCSMFP